MYSIEEFDKQKTKILKYIMYKKRTENEIRIKFNTIDEDLLEDSIEYLKEAGYINDKEYIERSVTEFKSLKNMSIKEVIYKLYSKGIKKDTLEDYVSNHIEELEEYEKKSAENIINKKINNMEKEDIINYLLRKGYKKLEDYVSNHIEELEEYEKKSAENIINKKINNMEKEDIINYLLRKGYKKDNIKIEE